MSRPIAFPAFLAVSLGLVLPAMLRAGEFRLDGHTFTVPEGSVLLLSIPRPVYPARALHAKVEGTVVIQACVVRDGSVQAMLVVDGGIDMLNSAALQAVRKARFRPFDSTDGYDSVWVRIPMRFSILPEDGDDRASHAGAGTSFSAVGTAEFDPAVTGGTDK